MFSRFFSCDGLGLEALDQVVMCHVDKDFATALILRLDNEAWNRLDDCATFSVYDGFPVGVGVPFLHRLQAFHSHSFWHFTFLKEFVHCH